MALGQRFFSLIFIIVIYVYKNGLGLSVTAYIL